MFKKNKLIEDLISLNIKPILVGGMVRDYFINNTIESKDIDIEIYTNKKYEEILDLLTHKNYRCDIVGKNFGVIKTRDENNNEIDISLPRIEKLVGTKHTDFEIISNGELSFKEAFKRRDFTFNAIGYDFMENKIIDLYNGVNDIKNKTIKHVSAKTFIEDPLRIYRAIQFAARFGFDIHPRTKLLIKDMMKNIFLI